MSDENLTARELFDRYTNVHDSLNKEHVRKKLQSLVIRYLVPAWGGPEIAGGKATQKDALRNLDFLRGVSVEELMESPNRLGKYLTEKSVLKENRRKFSYELDRWLRWVEKEGYYQSPKPHLEEGFAYERLHSPAGKAVYRDHMRLGRQKKPPCSLGAKCFPGDYINEALQREWDDFFQYRKNQGKSKKTIQSDQAKLLQILGWLHRYKSVALEDLRLSSIIHIYPHNFDLPELEDEGDTNAMIAYLGKIEFHKQNADNKAKKNLRLIMGEEVDDEVVVSPGSYIDFQEGHPNSQQRYIDALIALAKYLYRGEYNTAHYKEAGDIPIIHKLSKAKRTLSRKASQMGPTIAYEDKSVPWPKIVEALEKLRQRTDQEFTYSNTTRDGIQARKRTFYARSRDLQDFLSMALPVFCLPDRSRTYYELEIGRTLVYGYREGDSFRPEKDWSVPAHWYIRLRHEDTKSKKASWQKIPNIQFKDGKSFYEYVFKWLNEYRGDLDHNFFFTGKKHHRNPIDDKNWNDRIIHLFRRLVSVPISPHQLRSIYVTHLYNSGASEYEKRGAAQDMHHTTRIQEKIYNRQTHDEITRPIRRRHEAELNRLLSEM